jgi:hypothetical protein
LGVSATVLSVSQKGAENVSPKKAMDPKAAAVSILRGVERNQRMIVFPLGARLLWWAHRIHPALLTPLEAWLVKTLRAARTES